MDNFLDALLRKAVEQRASDLHLAVGLPPMIRIDGVLQPVGADVITAELVDKSIKGIVNEKQLARFQAELELDTAYHVQGVGRFRVNLHREKGEPGLVARVIPAVIPKMEDLSMPDVAYDMARAKQGLVLVTGPTGQGKSTTLAAMIELVNQEKAANIITLEDPIEYIYKPAKSIIKQRELGRDMLSFSEALKHVLRQDPNVILVGEMRDLETIAAAITVAETGHLVLATLHTYNAAQSIERMIDVFPPHQQDQVRIQLSNVLKGIISQRLLPKVGGGRIPAREIMVNTPAIAAMIRDNKVAQLRTAIETGAQHGMHTLEAELAQLVQAGTVAKDVAEQYAIDPSLL